MHRRLFLALPLAAQTRRVKVIAHRGEHRRHVENTLPAIEAAIAMGVDFVELDIRTTFDGQLVLMHDATVNRTTNGQGPVAEMTLAQIRELKTKDGSQVPTFAEALELLRASKTGLYLDAKRISAEDIVKSLTDHAMLRRTVVYGGFNLLKQLAAQGTYPLVMPEAGTLEHLQRLLRELSPQVIAFDRNDWKDDIVAAARAARVDLYVDRLGTQDTPDEWKAAIAGGATGIQTDHPAELLALLR